MSGPNDHERNALARLTLLARVGEILGSGLRREETLDRVAELLVPGLATYCAIDIADDDGELSAAASAFRTASRSPSTRRTGRRS